LRGLRARRHKCVGMGRVGWEEWRRCRLASCLGYGVGGEDSQKWIDLSKVGYVLPFSFVLFIFSYICPEYKVGGKVGCLSHFIFNLFT
jgi:hypothetical protein